LNNKEEKIFDAKSLGLFSYNNRFRILTVNLVENKYFVGTIIWLIIIDSLSQAMEDYSDPLNKTKLN